jgi:hypothetical protein
MPSRLPSTADIRMCEVTRAANYETPGPRREKSLKKRANIMEMTAFPWKDAMRPGSDFRIGLKSIPTLDG